MATAATTPPGAEAHFEAAHLKKEHHEEIKSDRIPTPPTSEDLNKHDDGHNSSELSDIEDDAELEDIKPDHYWDEENGGRIPVFKPTMDQFRDFGKFIAAIDSYGMQSGIVKVVPPPEWHESLGRLDAAIKSIRVKNPITQEFAGTHGTYTQANIEKQRSYNLPQWKSLCEESNHRTPARKGDRRREADAAKAARPTRNATATSSADGAKRRPGRPRKNMVKEEDVPEESVESDQTQVPPTPTSPNRGDDDDEEEDEEKPQKKARGRQARKPSRKTGPKVSAAGGRQPKAAKDVKKSVASRRLHNSAETWEIDEEAFEDFDYHLENVDQFDPDRCRELEETYWKTINFGTPMYGADMPGSLFDDTVTSWNVAHLPNLLDVLGTKVPGVNTAYLYLGMWKATFAWHLEDVDLYSINYIHFGAPKQWYSISQSDARKFENAMRTLWPQDYKHCDQFLRHKTYLISPEKLKSQFGIKVNKLVHHEGEFVITYPYGYHSGFNLGYNCAESVNFATEDWLNYGRIAKKCLCEADSVWVDVNEIERKLRGEPTPEYYTDDDSDEEAEVLLTPPPSVKGAKTGAGSKKRKRGPTKASSKAEPEKKKIKKIKIRLHPKSKEPCILCPNDATWDNLLPTDNGKQAHRLCALYTPETYIRKAEESTSGKETVCNVSHIDKARLDMRCNFCRSKKGSVFQCASKKCTRAFHATCAAAAGVLVDAGEVPTWDEEGTEYFIDGYDFRCRFHRPRRPKNSDGKGMDRLEADKVIRDYGRNLKPGEVAQAQTLDGEIFAGVVVENRHDEGMVLLRDIFDQSPTVSAHVEVEYKYLLVLDEAQSQRPKPSPDAKRLPDHLSNTKEHSAENRKDGVPSKGDPFMDPAAEQVWEEFNSVHSSECRNPDQKPFKIDLMTEGKQEMWYFLGATSTEARPQFTHDPKVRVHNPKSNFLDTVRASETPRYALPPQQRPNSYGSYVNYGNLVGGGALAPRPPVALQPRPSAGAGEMKPYEYKPKGSPPTSTVYTKGIPYQKWQVNTPSTQMAKQQQSPQPNVQGGPYPRYGSAPMSYYPNSRPLQSFGAAPAYAKSTTPPGVPPAATSSASTSPPVPPPNGTSSFYQQAERRYSSQQHGNVPFAGTPTPAPPAPTTTNTPLPTSTTPTSARPPVAPPHRSSASNATSANKAVIKNTSIDYLNHIQQYPFLRNSYMRRPEKYASPYSSSGGGFGFGAEYEMKLQRGITARGLAMQARREMEMRQQAVQHQSAESFRGTIKQESGGDVTGSHAGPGWGELLQRIGPQNTAPAAQMIAPTPSLTTTVTSTGSAGLGLSSSPYGVTAFAPPAPAPVGVGGAGGGVNSPMRPEYSPISGRASPAVPVGLGITQPGEQDRM